MNAHDHQEEPHRRRRLDWTSLAFAGFLAVAAFFLLSEHRAHALGALPFLILLACPLLHLFHHGGHGRPRGGEGEQRNGGGHRH